MTRFGTTRQSAGERTAATLSAAITLAAVVGVVLVAVLTSSGSSAGSALGGGPGGSGGSGGSISSGGGSVAGSPNVAGSSATAGSSFDVTRFRSTFPLPPGAVPQKLPFPSPHEKDYRVRAGLASIKSFYDKALRARGVTWSTQTTTESGSGKIVGWGGSMYHPGARMDATLLIDENFLGSAPGTVTIRVSIDTY